MNRVLMESLLWHYILICEGEQKKLQMIKDMIFKWCLQYEKKLIQKRHIILHHDKQSMPNNIKNSNTHYYCIAMVTKFDTPLLPIPRHDMYSCRHTRRTYLTALLWPRDNWGRFHKWPALPSVCLARHHLHNKSKIFKVGRLKRREIGRNDRGKGRLRRKRGSLLIHL